MLFQLKSYLNFILKSKKKHGIHSPFVYSLATQCLYDKTPKIWYKPLLNYRKSLSNNPTIISIEDFGAGSKSLQSNQRKVSNIAKNAGITNKRAQLLGRLSNYLEATTILEIGTSVGLASASLSLANPTCSILSLEGCNNTAHIAKTNFEKFDLKNIEIIIGNFEKTLPKALNNSTFDLIFFDGNHQKKPTIDYFEQCLLHINNNSVFVFDDIYWSKGMSEAWLYVKNHPKVTVSIDTFYWGIVFFRKEQEKEHFVVRM
ncbi:MAG TPA: methyltransferase [Flavobacteriaceae bacterium]|nr:methyltransferase [Flavobacteriaceae bacterium]